MQQLNMNTMKPWIIWLLAASFYALEFFQRVAPSVIAKPLMETFQLSPATFGLIVSFYFYAYGIFQIPAGILLDKYGPRLSLAMAALIVSIGTYLFAHTEQLSFLIMARILVGIGSAFAFVGCLKLARVWFSARSFPFVVGLTNTLGIVGVLFGQEPLTMMIEHLGWQTSLIISAYIGILIAILIFCFVKNKPPQRLHLVKPAAKTLSILHSLKIIFSSKQAWLISLYAGLMVAPIISFAELWAIPFMETNYNLSAQLAAQTNTLIFIGIAIGGPINGFVAAQLKRYKPVLYVGTCSALILFLLIILLEHMPLDALKVILFLFGFFTSSMLLSFSLNSEHHDKRISAAVVGFTNMIIMIIGSLFQPLIGKLLQLFAGSSDIAKLTPHAFLAALLILPAALLINLILLYFIREKSIVYAAN